MIDPFGMALLEFGLPCDTEVDVYAVAKGLHQFTNWR